MRRNGRLTKAEERTVTRALEIIDEWVIVHLGDADRPYAWSSIAASASQLEQDAWCMFEDGADDGGR